MRKVIVNSTPLIALCHANLLPVLKQLYGEITIPKAVYDEISVKPVLEVMIRNGIYIKPSLVELCLKQVGEKNEQL